MAWTQAQLDELEFAIASGAKKVKYADREVEYNSTADMLKLRDRIARSLESPKRPTMSQGVWYPGVD
jgi:hypothetical protein